MREETPAEQLARNELHSEVEMMAAIPLEPGELQVWRATNVMHSPHVNIFRCHDGTLLMPESSYDDLSRVLQLIRPPLNSPDAFVKTFNVLVGPDNCELSGHFAQAGALIGTSWPKPIYESGVLILTVGNVFTGSVERLTVTQDYTIRSEVIRKPAW